ncbi:unnamed protein product [Rotaria sp. Silwood2]|nr:unnamed protein product [Rotaria sp. Silwood2]CAF3036594.1 unnamed protein product [Rotaria sp. Silwood2]CAF3248486.1 unnamed protein product [Rotaria sp. Silwood2]CAF3382434.1 unnamed protein product [Rotaria sp. Silwood2]CAF4011912.1 unnamed protein product [Rotaria sp. Silwood2]
MEKHYLTKQHQNAITKAVRHILFQLNDRQIDTDLSRLTTAGNCNRTIAQLQELCEMLDILSGDIETLNKDQDCLSNESFRIQIALPTLTEELSQVKLSIEESHTFFGRSEA